ncbi:hypothetical protein AQ490_02855 [Wenjunlia vitaminophila]|uniref:Uncharacterized protein n=1 Tax=Wenjunlia vitaminophila TaxID=76728 RepID=A0A0T6LYP2_WENVI|nr:hypothetical protein [Wenjunlia vitaminophila]KRV51149.1 hypothetical protein AQ490_02855 [Wenjunlia vitaminophila]
MNQAARRFGKSLALVLPVVLVLSGTLAVTRVAWTPSGPDAQVLTASAEEPGGASSDAVDTRAERRPQEALRARLLHEVQTRDPGVALTHLQQEVARRPALAGHCASIARALGRAAVARYQGDALRAQQWSRPVCDTSFASGVLSAG